MYLSQNAIDDIKTNFLDYKRHFSDSTNQWFVDRFTKNNWLLESKLPYSDMKFDYNEDYAISDNKNVSIVYETLRHLTTSAACDERVWAGLLFYHCWDFVQYRRASELRSSNQRDILNSFFFLRGTKRSCFMNCLSRLWWTGYLFYDKDKDEDHYEAVDLICEHAYASNIMLISSNNFVSNKDILLGITDCLLMRKKKGDVIGRYHYVESNRYLNCIGGISLLDTLSRKEVCHMVNNRLNIVYGEIILDE